MTAKPSPSLSPMYTDSSDGPFITIHDVLQQYSLPYGIFGIISHILIYYTLVVLGLGNRPFVPWKPLKHSKINYFLGILSSTICVPVAVLTIYRVHELWCLVCIAVSQALTSFTLSLVTLHQRTDYTEKISR
ncbi:hypothetical protein BCR34DRAFT_560378 [Clohesyomyces aquaticus]|uniref:Uncharacterized protein n=1 Tax=Clohesyomyces aquaticus TaxID=1231657 RepID=A0A1Y1ZVX0_9PLEO|nr:hypothetical protein BCR34DRAFT_560378 [Clohesyomyces aquaticus]